jgi:hypothetical protein
MPHYRSRSHDAARDRLAPVTVEPIEALWPPAPKGVPAPQRTYAAYMDVLDRAFRGLAFMADVGLARAAWCQACSAEVERRRHERKALEGQMGRGWRREG